MGKKLDNRVPVLHYAHAMKHNFLVTRQLQLVRNTWDHPDIVKERTTNPEFKFLVQQTSVRQGMPPSMSVELEALFWYERFGQQSYVLGQRLQEMFKHTKLTGIEREHIKLPYKSFYVALEDSKEALWDGEDQCWHQLAGFYVVMDDWNTLYLYLWGKPRKNPRDDSSAWIKFDMDVIFGDHGDERYNDLEDYLQKISADYEANSNDDAEWLAVPPKHRAKATAANLAAARYAFNLIMYLQTQNKETKVSTPESRQAEFDAEFGKSNHRKGKAKLAKRDVAKAAKSTVTWIGRTVEREHRERKKAGLQPRQWVTGHWQHYWYGSGENKVRLPRHKQPYEKNVDSPTRIESRVYKSHDDQDDQPEA